MHIISICKDIYEITQLVSKHRCSIIHRIPLRALQTSSSIGNRNCWKQPCFSIKQHLRDRPKQFDRFSGPNYTNCEIEWQMVGNRLRCTRDRIDCLEQFILRGIGTKTVPLSDVGEYVSLSASYCHFIIISQISGTLCGSDIMGLNEMGTHFYFRAYAAI